MSAIKTSAASALAAAANAKQAKTNTPAKAPASPAAARKPRTGTNPLPKAQKAAVAPATQAAPQSLVAQGVAQVAAAATATPKAAKAPRAVPTTLLTAGKVFTPRTNQTGHEGDKGRWAQERNWNTVLTLLSDNGGTATYDQLVAAIQADAEKGGYSATCNARGFIQGRIRGNHLKAVA